MLGFAVRETGQAMDRLGCRIQGNYAYKERLCRHRRVMPLFTKKPFIGQDCFVAPNASVIGQVELGENSTVWYGAVLRADVNKVKIGQRTSIGDRCIVQVTNDTNLQGPFATEIGDGVIVGHGSILHGCTLEDECMVGLGCILYDGCVVEKHSILEAGSILTAGKRVGTRQLWGGNPAKFIREVTDKEVKSILDSSDRFVLLAKKHNEELMKTEQEREMERDADLYDLERLHQASIEIASERRHATTQD